MVHFSDHSIFDKFFKDRYPSLKSVGLTHHCYYFFDSIMLMRSSTFDPKANGFSRWILFCKKLRIFNMELRWRSDYCRNNFWIFRMLFIIRVKFFKFVSSTSFLARSPSTSQTIVRKPVFAHSACGVVHHPPPTIQYSFHHILIKPANPV
jgi:hypothetical protein